MRRWSVRAGSVTGMALLSLLWPPSTTCSQAASNTDRQPSSISSSPSASPRTSTGEQRSCREFVQGFYDWYWNRFADKADDLSFDYGKLPNVETVLERRPSVLNPKLYSLLAHEEEQMKITHEIGNLDFDPFWGNQDAHGRYLVDRVTVIGGRCRARIKQGNQGYESAELETAGSAWVFANIYYCFSPNTRNNCPDSDLIEILKPSK